MKTIIQFPHPGCEHTAKSGTKWNTSSHKRKYMKVKGSYLKKLFSKPIDDTVYFWGEWEAPSNVTPIVGNTPPLPLNIFDPCYTLPIPKNGANTDPFIFGNQFYYCICKQGHYPTLRNLDIGSLIIFGSHKEENFVIDTVFVVKGWRDYKISEILSLKKEYNEVFYHVSIEPIMYAPSVKCKKVKCSDTGQCLPEYGDDKNDDNPVLDVETYRIYEAVMYEERKKFDGMFSYAPCLPNFHGGYGFSRPFINTPIIIEPNLTQGIKITNIQTLWRNITQQVLNQGLNLMIKTELPLSCTNLKNQKV